MLRQLDPLVEFVVRSGKPTSAEGGLSIPNLPTSETWADMQARLITIGSPEVAGAFRQLGEVIQAFIKAGRNVRAMRAEGENPAEAVAAQRASDDARNRLKESFDGLARLVSDELAAL